MEGFGARLQELRKQKKWTQKELGAMLGVTHVSVSGYESGNRFPDTETLAKIADIFGVSTDYLLGRDVPEWASEKDVMDLEEMLNSNVNMAYGGENLTEEEKEQVKRVLTGLFWEKLEQRKRREADE
ncbi:helix-turn-helix domain-containing protein [Atopococcus tabaci]|uniref:helix-turn-helix domain-containing protein n=1 Tax=Atopococcus tabaci TaxID=269774 RepID=UPI00240A00F2|nr:helix-turn-helix transcriptional regulator [Atopococcus tabaci]